MKNLLMVITGAAFVALSTVGIAQAATVTIPVTEDESALLRYNGENYDANNSSYGGGLFSGVDGGISSSFAQFYLKFNLPTYVAKTQVTSATLTGYYNDDYNQADDKTHSIYSLPGYPGYDDSWSESTIDYDNQPYNYQYLRDYPRLAKFDAAEATVGTFVSWDITSAVNQEYQGDSVLSLLFRPDYDNVEPENKNWEYFAEKEFDSEKAFRLEVEIAPVPEPSATVGLLFGALGAVYLLKQRQLGR